MLTDNDYNRLMALGANDELSREEWLDKFLSIVDPNNTQEAFQVNLFNVEANKELVLEYRHVPYTDESGKLYAVPEGFPHGQMKEMSKIDFLRKLKDMRYPQPASVNSQMKYIPY